MFWGFLLYVKFQSFENLNLHVFCIPTENFQKGENFSSRCFFYDVLKQQYRIKSLDQKGLINYFIGFSFI